MSMTAILWVYELEGISSTAAHVLTVLATHLNESTGQCNPSMQRIAKCTKMGLSSVRRGLRELEDKGLISVLSKGTKDRKSTSYTINMPTGVNMTGVNMTGVNMEPQQVPNWNLYRCQNGTCTGVKMEPKRNIESNKESNLERNILAQSEQAHSTPPSDGQEKASQTPVQETEIVEPQIVEKKPQRKKPPVDDGPLSNYWLPLESGESWHFPVSYLDMLRSLYPSVNIDAEIRKMYGWLDSHPKNRKTKRGIKAFVTNWLNRCVDSRRGTAASTVTQKQKNVQGVLNLLDELEREREMEKQGVAVK